MRDKLISFGNCVSIFQPNLQRSFRTVSPIDILSGPAIPMLYSWAGSVSYTSAPSIAFGTIDRWRPDPKDPMPLNRDQWIVWSTGTANTVRIKEVKKSDILNHWSDSLPLEIKREAPEWAQDFIDKLLGEK